MVPRRGHNRCFFVFFFLKNLLIFPVTSSYRSSNIFLVAKLFISVFGNMKHRKKVISSKIHQVPEAMMHALLARHPKLEYAVGLDATFFFKPLVHIPTWIQDVILSWPKHNGPLAEELLA